MRLGISRSIVMMMFASPRFRISKTLLHDFWTSRYQLKIPNCTNIQWTCEHVVPKSLIREHDDMHNIILLPATINNMRSNYKYIENLYMDGLQNSSMQTRRVSSCSLCSQPQCTLTGRLYSNRLFIPPNLWKGQIARSALMMVKKYPHHRLLINNHVIDLSTALLWNYYFPPTTDDQQWDDIINTIQGDSNPYTWSKYSYQI